MTGASRGIGRAIALELARRGATVIGTATSEAGAQGDHADADRSRFKGRGIVLNVADPQSDRCSAEGRRSGEGAPTILVNNAGITRDNLLLRMKAEEWDEIINTNLGSVYRLSKGVLRGMMKARRGRIISIASVVGVMGNAGQTNYAAAKAGIIGFSQIAGARGRFARHHGERRGAGFHRDRHDRASCRPSSSSNWLQQIALGRLGSPEDIAHAVAFLASPQAGYITGETLHVNGGMYMV